MSFEFVTAPAVSYICRTTGTITKIVSTKASPVMIWFGGTCCVPSAFRTIESTTEIFTNEVSITTIKGANANAPRTITITIGLATGAPACAVARAGNSTTPSSKAPFIAFSHRSISVSLPHSWDPVQQLAKIPLRCFLLRDRLHDLRGVFFRDRCQILHLILCGADQEHL